MSEIDPRLLEQYLATHLQETLASDLFKDAVANIVADLTLPTDLTASFPPVRRWRDL